MSSGSTKRKPQTPTGDETLPSVVAANCIAVRSALLVLLATVMGLHFIATRLLKSLNELVEKTRRERNNYIMPAQIEQPGSSQLINLDVFQNIFRNLGLKVWFQKLQLCFDLVYIYIHICVCVSTTTYSPISLDPQLTRTVGVTGSRFQVMKPKPSAFDPNSSTLQPRTSKPLTLKRRP